MNDLKASPVKDYPLTEYGNAQRLVDKFRDRMRFHASRGRWLHWGGNRWRVDEGSIEIAKLAKVIARSFWRDVPNAADRDILTRHANSSEKASGIEAMIKLARSEPGIAVDADELDCDPWAFNVKNGTVDLRTGRMTPHRPEDLITKVAPVVFDASAPCPLWDQFMAEIMAGNIEMIQYLQRLAGLFLTADISVQEFFILYGDGANGKNVFLDTLCGLMGNYASPAPDGLITVRKHNEHPTEIADLLGRRLVVASELEEDAKLKVALVKRLTGDVTLKARFMKQDFFHFTRSHKLVAVTNSKPQITETTNAIWRRVRLIPFNVTIPKEKQDPRLTDKLKEEWPGILGWAIRGCLDWQRGGMQTPDQVIIASEAYQAEQDVLGDYVRDRLLSDPSCRIARGDLYADYESWAAQVRTKPIGKAMLYARIRKEKGVTEAQWDPPGLNVPVRGFSGIGLRSVAG